jgi:hypothetical protein
MVELSVHPWVDGGQEEVQLEIRHAIGDLVEDISEKKQESIDRGRDWIENTTQRVLQGKSLRTSYPDQLESGRDVSRMVRADSSNS